MNVAEKVTEIVAENLGYETKEVLGKSNLRDDLGADSLDVINVIMDVETAFDMQISDTEAEGVNTVDDLITVVQSKLS